MKAFLQIIKFFFLVFPLPRYFSGKVLKYLTPSHHQQIFFSIYRGEDGWQGALRACSGYDSDIILKKCRQALLQVKNGMAEYERDSFLFEEISYSWPLLSGLLWVAAQDNDALNVLDFGGSLGTTYFQNRKFLASLKHLSWNVIEQKHFVECGQSEFQDHRLKFYDDIDSCLQKVRPQVLIFSSFLPYIEHFDICIENVLKYNFPYIILDRTPFIDMSDHVLMIETVPPSIYSASYPVWFFNYDKLLSLFQKKYKVVADFESYTCATKEVENIPCYEKGMILSLKGHA